MITLMNNCVLCPERQANSHNIKHTLADFIFHSRMCPGKERQSAFPNPVPLPAISWRAATPELLTELLYV